MSLGRTDTALGAFYRRLAGRIGKPQALTATARKLAILVYRALKGELTYHDPGADGYAQQQRTRSLRRIRQRAATLGFDLVNRETGELLMPFLPNNGGSFLGGGSAPAPRRARERVGESEGRSPSGKQEDAGSCGPGAFERPLTTVSGVSVPLSDTSAAGRSIRRARTTPRCGVASHRSVVRRESLRS